MPCRIASIPPSSRTSGLIEALKSECERFSQTVQLDWRRTPGTFPMRCRTTWRCACFASRRRDCATLRATPERAERRFRLQRLDGGLELTVKDDGAGFDPGQHRAGMSLGHASMRQSVALLGGKIDIESSSGHGTTILAWVPLREPSDLSARAG